MDIPVNISLAVAHYGIKRRLAMSLTRIKIMAAESVEILERHVNIFLAQDDIELKQLDYQTDGYEKPYSIAILYHEKNEPRIKHQNWRDKIFNKR